MSERVLSREENSEGRVYKIIMFVGEHETVYADVRYNIIDSEYAHKMERVSIKLLEKGMHYYDPGVEKYYSLVTEDEFDAALDGKLEYEELTAFEREVVDYLKSQYVEGKTSLHRMDVE